MESSSYKPQLHWIALLTAAATFPLIFMGGLVTSHGAGMSVPDWPNSYGYNMFTFPPSKWIGGIFYEHTHRLMGTVVGICAIALMLQAWGFGKRRDVTRAICLAAGAIISVAVLLFVGAMLIPAASDEHRMVRFILKNGAIGLAAIALLLICATFFRD